MGAPQIDLTAVETERDDARRKTCAYAGVLAILAGVLMIIVGVVLPILSSVIHIWMVWLGMGLEAIAFLLFMIAYWIDTRALGKN